jgi:hypothetical protein
MVAMCCSATGEEARSLLDADRGRALGLPALLARILGPTTQPAERVPERPHPPAPSFLSPRRSPDHAVLIVSRRSRLYHQVMALRALLVAVLATVLVGAHAPHLPILDEDWPHAIGTAQTSAHVGAHLASSETAAVRAPRAALAPSAGDCCPVEAFVPPRATLALAAGISLLAVAVASTALGGAGTTSPLGPAAHRRRALLRVYQV